MTAFAGFGTEGLEFLAGLAKHNEKKWFEANRSTYDDELLEPARAFVSTFGDILHESVDEELRADPRVGGSIFRIHRDTRFSKDKSPYKTYFDMVFVRGDEKATSSPGFFVRIEPDKITLAGGTYDLSMAFDPYRSAVDDANTGKAVEKAITTAMKAKGVGLWGDSYKRVPKGFDADHPRGELLKRKGLCAFVESEIPAAFTTKKFPDWVMKRIEPFVPLYRWLAAL